MERVRVVSEPHSDYTRFGIDLARRLNVPAGEDIRYLPRVGRGSWACPAKTSGCWTPPGC